MDAQLLLDPNPWLRACGIALLLLPPLFILCSRRASWWTKPLWVLATQLPWAFALLYTWVWHQRYGDAAPPQGAAPQTLLGDWVHADAIGWWTYAFPWAVYLLYRATRKWFPGEKRRA
jgi:hypothetical protein